MARSRGDAAAEPLDDELLARIGMIVEIVPLFGVTASSPQTYKHLAAHARHTLDALREPSATAVGETVIRTLWPHGAHPPHDRPWWSTPLGAVLVDGVVSATSHDETHAHFAPASDITA